MRVTVIGDGAWGTTLASHLSGKGFQTTLWSAFPEYAAVMRRSRANTKFLPGIHIPEAVNIVSKDSGRLGEADLLVSAVPAQFLRAALTAVKSQLANVPDVVSVTKGIENETLMPPTQIIRQVLRAQRVAVLSGPSHAEEVARGLPSTVVAASENQGLETEVQNIFNSERFRIYTSTDPLGVELAGALKNVIAIAAGICEGLGFGDNSKAALVTRGMVEIARLGQRMGARWDTFAGLAGIGDLITTCFSPYGRNRAVGLAIGKGKTLTEVLAGMEQVAEGVATTRSAVALGRKYGVEMPITSQLHAVLFQGVSPLAAVTALMTRQLRSEEDH